MNSKDKISIGFDELRNSVNKELYGRSNSSESDPLQINNTKPASDEISDVNSFNDKTVKTSDGTRVFNTTKYDTAAIHASNVGTAPGMLSNGSYKKVVSNQNIPNIDVTDNAVSSSNPTWTKTNDDSGANSAAPVTNSNTTRVTSNNGVNKVGSFSNQNAGSVVPNNGMNRTAPTANPNAVGNNPNNGGARGGAAFVPTPNNITRVMPRTSVAKGSAQNNSTTRIMPGVSPFVNKSSGYNTNDTTITQRQPNFNSSATSDTKKITYNVRTSADNDSNRRTVLMGSVPAGATCVSRSRVSDKKTTIMPTIRPGSASAKPTGADAVSKKKKRRKNKGNPLAGVIKFVLYVSFVIVTSIFLAKYFIGVGNDIFAFIKDTYNFTDTVYSVKGEATNSFKITDTKLSGDKFEFSYAFKNPLTEEEKNTLDATVIVISAKDNSVIHNYGKFYENVSEGKPISVDLSNAKMTDGEYLLRLTVNTGNSVSYITEFTFSKKFVDITIKDEASTGEVARLLEENGVIDHPTAFKLYANLKKDGKAKYIAGSHQLYLGMDYDEIISAISPKAYTRSIVKLTFPEGATVDDIINRLINGGVQNSKQDYIEALKKYDVYDYRFVDLLKEQGLRDGRVYSLEGYLFPDTYEFYTDSSPEAVIDKFLANFDAKFDESFYDEAERLGLTVDEIITIASLVETEAGNSDDKGNIASVFHNRLNNAALFRYLESDATTDYASYNLKSNLKLTEYKCRKCGEKATKFATKCSNCGNSNSYDDYKCASFSVDLSAYNLIDADYYINFNMRTDTTRSVVLVHINKKTVGEKEVYSITSQTTSDTPANGDLKITIANVNIDADNILTCEFKLEHSFDSETFIKFPMKLNLFRTAYNTYLTEGIMPSAVANPGYESIIAALYPNSTNYYFFVADSSGDSHFSTTNDEHNAKIAQLEKVGKAVSAN